MKAICIPAFDRAEMLQATLRAIPATRSNDWMLYLSLDAPIKIEDKLRLSDLKTVRIWTNGRNLGCRLNTFLCCQSAIDDGAEAILSMDDDIILSPDALKLCDWYLRMNLDSRLNAGLALCRREGNDPSNPNTISKSETHLGHLGQGHCFSREMWFDFIARSFWTYEPSYQGPDWAVCAEAMRTGRTIMRPKLARARHAGAVGYHGAGLGVFPEIISDGTRTDYIIE